MRRGALLLVLLALGAHARAEEEEWERPYAGLLPVVGKGATRVASADFVAVRILDAATGKPIPGARLSGYEESLAGLTVVYAPLVGAAVADALGFAWVPEPPGDPVGHWVAEAPGFAPAYAFELPDARVELRPGTDVTARLVDAMGKPVAGAEVEQYLGCPHGPTQERVVSAADGTFTLHAVDPALSHLWVRAPGCASDLHFDVADLMELGERRADLVLRAAATVRGRVVDAAGKPIAKAGVRCDDLTRGPATLTAEDGTFVLHGAGLEATLRVFHPVAPSLLTENKGSWIAPSVDGADPAVPLTIPLSKEGLLWDEEDDAGVLLRVLGRGHSGVEIFGVRLTREDGRTFVVEVDPRDEETAAWVPPGTYRVTAASAFGPAEFPPATVVAPAGEPVPLTLAVVPRPRLEVRGVGADVRATLAVAGEETDLFEERPVVFLPATVPAVLRVGRSFFDVGPAKDGVRVVEVRFPRPSTIRVKGVPSMDGAYLTRPPWEPWLEATARGDVLETHAAGDLRLHVDDFVFAVRLPADAPTDLILDPARDALPEGPSFDARVLFARPDGSAPKGVLARVEGMPVAPGASTPREAAESSTTYGATSPLEVRGPCRVVLEAPGFVTLRAAITKSGDTTLSWGRCSIRLDVRDVAGAATEASVLVDEELYPTAGGRLELAGLLPGAHRVIVSPVTRKKSGVEMRVVLKEAETRAKTVTLPSRP